MSFFSRGSTRNLTLDGNDRNNVIVGRNGDDVLSGHGGNDYLFGGRGDDELNGGSGNDYLVGGRGSDSIFGGSGNDILIGDGCWWQSGDDLLKGGSGNDRLFAGYGNDEAVYEAAINQGSWDYYDGGWGVDTLTLEFTASEWAQTDIRDDVAAYVAYLDAQANSSRHWHWSGCDSFRFEAFNLIARRFENLKVLVDGVEVNPTNNDPTVTGTVTNADATEDGGPITVDLLEGASDLDGDTLNVTNVSTLPAGVTLNGNSLEVDPADASFQSLAEGETTDIVVTYDIEDGNGGSVCADCDDYDYRCE